MGGHRNGSSGMSSISPVVKMELEDSRSPYSSQGSLPGGMRMSVSDSRKKEKRKYRASSLESSESDASLCGVTGNSASTEAQVIQFHPSTVTLPKFT